MTPVETAARTRIDQLSDELSNWQRCRACDGAGEIEDRGEDDNLYRYYCSCGDGRRECAPPDPAEYQPDYDITGQDRTELVEELYLLRRMLAADAR